MSLFRLCVSHLIVAYRAKNTFPNVRKSLVLEKTRLGFVFLLFKATECCLQRREYYRGLLCRDLDKKTPLFAAFRILISPKI